MLENKWYLVYTKARKEHLASLNLTRQGYTAFFPRIEVQKRRRGRRVSIIEPMFPRYIFIQFDPNFNEWAPIRSTIGVGNLVEFGCGPAIIPNALVDDLKGRVDEFGIFRLDESRITDEFHINEGDRVTVMSGVLEGYEGIFQSNRGNDRAQILLTIAGKCLSVEISKSYVEAIQI